MKNKKKEINRLTFPEPSEFDFGHYPKLWFKEVLEKSKTELDPKYEKMSNKLFFEGGDIPYSKRIDEDYKQNGFIALSTILSSWDPKHEHKSAVCGMILQSLCE